MSEDDRREFASLGVTIVSGDDGVGGNAADDAFGVWDINWRSFGLFLDCETQWRVAGGFRLVRLGIDYGAVDALLGTGRGRHRRGRDHELFEDVRVMERAALDVFAEVAE